MRLLFYSALFSAQFISSAHASTQREWPLGCLAQFTVEYDRDPGPPPQPEEVGGYDDPITKFEILPTEEYLKRFSNRNQSTPETEVTNLLKTLIQILADKFGKENRPKLVKYKWEITRSNIDWHDGGGLVRNPESQKVRVGTIKKIKLDVLAEF